MPPGAVAGGRWAERGVWRTASGRRGGGPPEVGRGGAGEEEEEKEEELHDRPAPTHTPTTRMEIRTWRSAIADLKPTPPGAPSGALGEGTPGWVWRCDAAILRYH